MPLICDGDLCEYIPSERHLKCISDDEQDDEADAAAERRSSSGETEKKTRTKKSKKSKKNKAAQSFKDVDKKNDHSVLDNNICHEEQRVKVEVKKNSNATRPVKEEEQQQHATGFSKNNDNNEDNETTIKSISSSLLTTNTPQQQDCHKSSLQMALHLQDGPITTRTVSTTPSSATDKSTENVSVAAVQKNYDQNLQVSIVNNDEENGDEEDSSSSHTSSIVEEEEEDSDEEDDDNDIDNCSCSLLGDRRQSKGAVGRTKPDKLKYDDNNSIVTEDDYLYLLDDSNIETWDDHDDDGLGCFPSSSDKKNDTFVLYNPYIISYMKILNKKSPPESPQRILFILGRLIQAVTIAPETYISTISFHGGVAAILTCMNTHSKNIKIQERSCYFLGLMTQSGNNLDIQEKVSSHFGITYILACMTTYSKSSTLHQSALFVTSCIISYDTNAYQFTMNRGVNIVMKSLNAFSKNLQIQIHGTTILRLLSIKQMSCIDNTPNVVNIIISGMKQHKNSNIIQINGCSTLYALARDGHNPTTQDCLTIKHNIVPYLLKCMLNNMHIPLIQCQCCSTLQHLASRRSETRDAMVRDGAVSVIWRILKFYPKNQDVQREGTKALKCLSKGPNEKEGNEAECTSSSFTEVPDCINDECYL